MIALKTLFDPAAAGDLDVTVELRLGDDRFRAAVEGGRFVVARGEATRPTRSSAPSRASLAGVLWHGRPLDDVAVEGDRYLLARFLRRVPGGGAGLERRLGLAGQLERQRPQAPARLGVARLRIGRTSRAGGRRSGR